MTALFHSLVWNVGTVTTTHDAYWPVSIFEFFILELETAPAHNFQVGPSFLKLIFQLPLLVNSYALYVLGREVETIYGSTRFTVIYLLSGISGAIFSYMLTQGLSAGASTSLFGLFGALAVFFFKQRQLLGAIGRQRLINLGMTLVINVIIGLSPGSSIDNWGHVGGVIGGAILAWFLCPTYALANPVEMEMSQPVENQIDLPEGQLKDTNTLAKQGFAVGLFGLGLVALTVVARMAQSS